MHSSTLKDHNKQGYISQVFILQNYKIQYKIIKFKLLYLFWFKIEQTFPEFGVILFCAGSQFSVVSQLASLGCDDFFTPRHFQRLETAKPEGADPGISRNLQRGRVEVTKRPQ